MDMRWFSESCEQGNGDARGEGAFNTGAERKAVAKGLLNKWRSTYMPHGDSACLEAVTFREAECYEVV
jgi:hypothetical protein